MCTLGVYNVCCLCISDAVLFCVGLCFLICTVCVCVCVVPRVLVYPVGTSGQRTLTAAQGVGEEDGAGGAGAEGVPGREVQVVGGAAGETPHHGAPHPGVCSHLHPLPSTAPVVHRVPCGRYTHRRIKRVNQSHSGEMKPLTGTSTLRHNLCPSAYIFSTNNYCHIKH